MFQSSRKLNQKLESKSRPTLSSAKQNEIENMPRIRKVAVNKPQDTIKNTLVHESTRILPKVAPKATYQKDLNVWDRLLGKCSDGPRAHVAVLASSRLRLHKESRKAYERLFSVGDKIRTKSLNHQRTQSCQIKDLFETGMGIEDVGAPLGVSRPRAVRSTKPEEIYPAAQTRFKIAYSEHDKLEFRPHTRQIDVCQLPAYLKNMQEKKSFTNPSSAHHISRKVDSSKYDNPHIRELIQQDYKTVPMDGPQGGKRVVFNAAIEKEIDSDNVSMASKSSF